MRSAATAFPRSPEGAAAPESCLLSITLPPTPPQLSIGAGPDQAFFLAPPPPRMDRPSGRGGGWRARPAVSYGGGPAGGRALAGYLVGRSRALPYASCGEVGAAPAAAATASPGPPPLVPSRLSPFLPLTPE